MSRYKDIMKTIDSTTQLVNPRYDVSFDDAKTIAKHSNGDIDKVYNGFRLGFLQGMKAAKAEMKGGAAV